MQKHFSNLQTYFSLQLSEFLFSNIKQFHQIVDQYQLKIYNIKQNMGQINEISTNRMLSNWQQSLQTDVLTNMLTNEQVHRHYVTIHDSQNLRYYSMRMHEHYTYIVRVLYYHPAHLNNYDNPPKQFVVYTQRTLPVTEWRKDTSLIVMKGFRRLFANYQPFKVDRSMIFENERGQVKVWLHNNPIINIPQHSLRKQQQMLSDIAVLLNKQDKQSASMLLGCTNFTQAIKKMSQMSGRAEDRQLIYLTHRAGTLNYQDTQNNPKISFDQNNFKLWPNQNNNDRQFISERKDKNFIKNINERVINSSVKRSLEISLNKKYNITQHKFKYSQFGSPVRTIQKNINHTIQINTKPRPSYNNQTIKNNVPSFIPKRKYPQSNIQQIKMFKNSGENNKIQHQKLNNFKSLIVQSMDTKKIKRQEKQDKIIQELKAESQKKDSTGNFNGIKINIVPNKNQLNTNYQNQYRSNKESMESSEDIPKNMTKSQGKEDKFSTKAPTKAQSIENTQSLSQQIIFKKQHKEEMVKQLKKQFEQILLWSNHESETFIDSIKKEEKTKTQKLIPSNFEEDDEQIQRQAINVATDNLKDKLIREKVEKKKASFATLKNQAMKILFDENC